jgi:hypothetical protein
MNFRPNMIENMCMSNPNIYHDKFIGQLVNMAQNSIIESPYKCMPTSKSSSGISHTSVNHEFQPSPISFIISFSLLTINYIKVFIIHVVIT